MTLPLGEASPISRLVSSAMGTQLSPHRSENKSISARAAAIAAGIIKPPTPLDILRRTWAKGTWAKASPDERAAFRPRRGPGKPMKAVLAARAPSAPGLETPVYGLPRRSIPVTSPRAD